MTLEKWLTVGIALLFPLLGAALLSGPGIGVGGYLGVYLLAIVYPIFMGSPWCYRHAPQWLSLGLIPASIVISLPITFLIGWPIFKIAHSAVVTALPWWLNLAVFLALSFSLVVLLRGFISRFPLPLRFILSMPFWVMVMSAGSEDPVWLKIGLWLQFIFWITALFSMWLSAGRRLGFRDAIRGFRKAATGSVFGPGYPLGEAPPKAIRSWHASLAEEDELSKPSTLFGNARVASIDELKKGGLL